MHIFGTRLKHAVSLRGGGREQFARAPVKGAPKICKMGATKGVIKNILDLNFTGIGLKKCVLPVFLQVFEPFYFRNVRENFFYSSPLANIFGKT